MILNSFQFSSSIAMKIYLMSLRLLNARMGYFVVSYININIKTRGFLMLSSPRSSRLSLAHLTETIFILDAMAYRVLPIVVGAVLPAQYRRWCPKCLRMPVTAFAVVERFQIALAKPCRW